jgi:hypothetical protein
MIILVIKNLNGDEFYYTSVQAELFIGQMILLVIKVTLSTSKVNIEHMANLPLTGNEEIILLAN